MGRLIYFIPIWLIVLALMLPVYLLGWILIPIALLCKAYEGGYSKYFWEGSPGFGKKKIMKWKWGFMYPWGNEEDGILCGEEFLGKPDWFRILYWTAWRNPSNNLRFVPIFSTKYDQKELAFAASFEEYPYLNFDNLKRAEEIGAFWYLCWQGLYGNFRIQFRLGETLYRFWIGHSLYPSGIYKIPDYQAHGAGFKLQLKRVR